MSSLDELSSGRASVGSPTELPDSLRRFALDCITHALDHGGPPAVDPASVPAAWLEPRACFVTLKIRGVLRGCTGTFDASVALVSNVVSSAYRAAFHDPRFPPLTREELPLLEVEVSLLSATEPLEVASREQLLARLRPGIDGLVVSEGSRRATFLPSVWDSLSDPSDFVDELFRKAGLPARHWSPDLRFETYSTTTAD